MSLRSVVGRVRLEVWHGRDPADKHWGCPIRERWGLRAHQQMSPVLEEKLAFTATLTGSYEGAAQVAGKWGSEVDDSVVHALVQRAGSQAEAQTQARLKQLPQESQPQRRASQLALLMVDGWFARFRGPGWGKKASTCGAWGGLATAWTKPKPSLGWKSDCIGCVMAGTREF